MAVVKEAFGKTKDGTGVTKFTITNKNGMSVSLLDYGAIVQAICVPKKNGGADDIALGFDDVAGYEVNSCYFGAFVGRHANRIGGARFDLNGTEYELQKNDNGCNNLHGGDPGYHKLMYRGDTAGESAVYFERVSPDMEQGFPGALEVKVTYTLTDENELVIEYFARSDADTIYNPTNHTYFNLLGHDGGDITHHKVKINADAVTESSKELIPNGKFIKVEGTPFDFREEKAIYLDIEADNEQLKNAGGYDHNFCLMKEPREYGYAGSFSEETTGRRVDIYTDLPGMQFYSGNFIEKENGKDGAVYTKRTGMCFETQFFPNAVNIPEFTSCYLPKGEAFNSKTVYKFSW
ncbi:MAG: galactose mutarotase [Eubacterium sp.]|nr:galactose mutarotase [Eubacterium sp.]